ncbi:MAG: FAD-dependent oxidoreductase, partial [Actinobacteria bacterium]|nr:FAD-dependent oxidoreductase [Actinomycetota bacterium]
MKKDIYDYDIIVIGGGISGCEASFTSASNGARTLLISISMDNIGYMPISNIISNKKGISAVGKTIWNGLIFTRTAKNNMLNTDDPISGEKGKTVDNMIIDRKRQMMDIKKTVESQENISTRQGLVTEVGFKNNIYSIITSDDTTYKSRAVIISCGTFLDSYIFWGGYSYSAGRPGEITSKKLLLNL